jgi:RNA polymerase sigma-70 factor, ECF subfamily
MAVSSSGKLDTSADHAARAADSETAPKNAIVTCRSSGENSRNPSGGAVMFRNQGSLGTRIAMNQFGIAARVSTWLVAHEQDCAIARAIQDGDRAELVRLVEREHTWLVRLARAIVRDDALADEVVQDAWIAILRALGTFEGRSSLRTWMATIVLNRAKTVASRSKRTVAVGALGSEPEEDDEGACFRSIGVWIRPPGAWSARTPEALMERKDLLERVGAGLAELPENQRTVLTLRDIQGWSSEEVRNALGLSESNQRVLLHRARQRIRALLARELGHEVSS